MIDPIALIMGITVAWCFTGGKMPELPKGSTYLVDYRAKQERLYPY